MAYKKPQVLTINLIVVFILVGASFLSQRFFNNEGDTKTEQEAVNLYQKDFLFFGTKVDAQILTQNPEKANHAFLELEKLYADIHKNWHAWEKGGLLYQINQAFQEGKSIEVNSEVASLIEQADEISNLSSGFFNPSIGSLISLWGFLGDDWINNPKLPEDEKIKQTVLQNPQMDDIQIQSTLNPNIKKLSSNNKFVRLDMGAIAKGYAIDLAIDLFKGLGIESALVNAGGDLRVLGEKFNQPWSIGINDPFNEQVLGKVLLGGQKDAILPECLRGCAIASSGNTERYFIYKNTRYTHIINPKTGYPVSDFAQVSVIHPSATFADASATALFVAGKENFEKVAQQLGLRAYAIVDKDKKLILSYHMNKIFTPLSIQ